MSEFDTTFERLIELMIDKRVPMSVAPGKVSDIDKANDTCNVELTEGQTLFGVRLRAVIDGDENKCVIYPVVGSNVITILIENDIREAFLLSCSNIESISVKVGEKSLTVDDFGFVFNEGTDGMVRIAEMVSWMSKVHDDLATLKTLLQTSPIAGNGAPANIIFNPTTPTPQQVTFEDVTIKH